MRNIEKLQSRNEKDIVNALYDFAVKYKHTKPCKAIKKNDIKDWLNKDQEEVNKNGKVKHGFVVSIILRSNLGLNDISEDFRVVNINDFCSNINRIRFCYDLSKYFNISVMFVSSFEDKEKVSDCYNWLVHTFMPEYDFRTQNIESFVCD